jgi:hypothetical protein
VILDDDEPYVACQWAEIPGARYTLEVQTYDPQTGQWTSKLWESLTAPNKTPPHEAPRRGRWRVRASRDGGESPWSVWRHFGYHGEGAATDSPESEATPPPSARAPAEKEPAGPPAPILSSPASGEAIVSESRSVTLEWRPVEIEGGATYTCVVEVERSAGGPGGQAGWEAHAFPNLLEPRLLYQHPSAGRARWWAVATDGAGAQSPPSELRELRFEPPGAPGKALSSSPEPLAPSGGANVPPGALALTWRPAGGDSTECRVEVQALESPGKGGGLWRSVWSQTAKGASCQYEAGPRQKLRWRVGLAAPGGGSESMSPWQRFQTGE